MTTTHRGAVDMVTGVEALKAGERGAEVFVRGESLRHIAPHLAPTPAELRALALARPGDIRAWVPTSRQPVIANYQTSGVAAEKLFADVDSARRWVEAKMADRIFAAHNANGVWVWVQAARTGFWVR